MSLLWARLRMAATVLRYPEAWRLPSGAARTLLGSLSVFRPVTAGTGTILYVNAPPVEHPAFRSYLGGLKRMAAGETVPLTVHISVTDRCGYACERCSNRFMRSGSSAADPSPGDIARLIASLKCAGTVSVVFTGGEPLLRDDLSRMVQACGPEIAPALFTSGQGVTAERARELRAAGLVMAAVSLDSHDERVHDAMRGKAGAFRQAVQAIRSFLEAGLYVAAQAVTDEGLAGKAERCPPLSGGVAAPGLSGSPDRPALSAFLAFCGELGVHEVMLLDPQAFGAGQTVETGGDERRQWLHALHLRSAAGKDMPKVTTAAYLESEACLGCQGGYSFFYVSAAGELCPCDFAPLSFGNVYKDGLEAVLRRVRGSMREPGTCCLAAEMGRHIEPGRRLPLQSGQTGEVLARCARGARPRLMRNMIP